MSQSTNRFFGGSPIGVLVRLAIISLIVGIVLATLGLDPTNIWESVGRAFRSAFENIGDVFRWSWRYFLLGAIVVFPIWLIFRIISMVSGRR